MLRREQGVRCERVLVLRAAPFLDLVGHHRLDLFDRIGAIETAQGTGAFWWHRDVGRSFDFVEDVEALEREAIFRRGEVRIGKVRRGEVSVLTIKNPRF